MDTINTSIDTNSVDKKKKSFLPKLLIALSSLFSIVGVGLAFLPNHYKSVRAVSYDDDNETITLSVDELNNYHFDNIYTFINTFSQNIEFVYDTKTFYYGGEINGSIGYADRPYTSSVSFIIDYLLFNSSNNTNFSGNYYFSYNFSYLGFTSSLIIDCSNLSNADYSNFKQAIEQDIAANQPYTNNTFFEDIIELLVGGIGVTASGIGSGLSVLVSNIAIQNGAMSPFMAIVLIFGGIALALALSRWVVNLIGSLGQRNR